MSGSIYNEIKDLINNVDSDEEIIVALSNAVEILAKKHDIMTEKISELNHELDVLTQYVDKNIN